MNGLTKCISSAMQWALALLLLGGVSSCSEQYVADESVKAPATRTSVMVGKTDLNKIYGYGAETTGGQGAKDDQTFHFNDGKAFYTWLNTRQKKKDATPAVVYLSGTFTKDDGRSASSPWFDIKDTKNITIIGTKGFTMEHVGFFIKRGENIIIRNLYIKMPKADNGADGISMQEGHKIWIDHCTFESFNQTKDYEDGSCDVTHATDNVTVSWCHFIKTQKSCLVGHSNGQTADAKITVTFHHNYFDKSSSRHPRVRFGRAHVYNNFFDGCTTYGVGSAYGAKVFVENNYFDSVVLPIDICTYKTKTNGKSNLEGSVAGYVYERGNEFANRPANSIDPYPLTNLEYKAAGGEKLSKPLTYDDFKPSYAYDIDDAADIPAIVSASAGSGKLSQFDKAPISVNNGNVTTNPDPEPNPEPEPEPEKPDAGSSLGNSWKYVNSASIAVKPVVTNGKLTFAAGGKFESGAQGFGCVYNQTAVSGDFEVTVKLDAYNGAKSSKQGLAGLFVTSDPMAAGKDLLYIVSAKGGDGNYYGMIRSVAGGKMTNAKVNSSKSPSSAPLLKLVRKGNTCYISYSSDGGKSFSKEKNFDCSGFPSKVYLGLAVSSGDNKKAATATFSGFTFNGKTVPF